MLRYVSRLLTSVEMIEIPQSQKFTWRKHLSKSYFCVVFLHSLTGTSSIRWSEGPLPHYISSLGSCKNSNSLWFLLQRCANIIIITSWRTLEDLKPRECEVLQLNIVKTKTCGVLQLRIRKKKAGPTYFVRVNFLVHRSKLFSTSFQVSSEQQTWRIVFTVL